MGALSYRVWYFASLQLRRGSARTTTINGRRQQVQILFARQQQASSWFNPELLAIPLDDDPAAGWTTTPTWPSTASRSRACFTSRSTCSTSTGERLLSYAGRFNSVPHDSYSALTTADMKFPDDHARRPASRSTLTYGQYRALLETNRQPGGSRDRVPRVSSDRTPTTRTPTRRCTTACCSATGFTRGRAATRRRSMPRCTATTFPPSVVENLIARHQGRRGAAAPVSSAAPARAWRRTLPAVRRLRARSSSTMRAIPTTRWGTGSSIRCAARAASISSTCGDGVRRPLDRRVRERRQAQRRLLGARVRRAPVHAAQLQRDARRGLHAGARDGPLDAHAAGASGAAVRVRGLHDLRRRGAVDAERGAVPRPHAGAGRHGRESAPSCCSTPSTASRARSTRR